MSYIDSTKIEVFPVAKARINNDIATAPGTRILTERNISNLSRQLLSKDNPGYIISCEEVSANSFNIAFNLYGYYFNITEFNPSIFTDDIIYANITINDGNGEIDGQDEIKADGSGYEYRGLDLSTKATSGGISMKLFEKVNGSWTYAKSSFGLASALVIGGIDGKRP